MVTLDEACENVVKRVNGAIACAVVDLDSGFALGQHDSERWGEAIREAMATVALEIFRGARVTEVARALREQLHGGEGEEHYFDEVQLTSPDHLYFAMVLPTGRCALILVTNKTTNVGMGWAQLKSASTEIKEHAV